jgi:hypothetical protein
MHKSIKAGSNDDGGNFIREEIFEPVNLGGSGRESSSQSA